MAREELARDVYDLLRLAQKIARTALRNMQGADRDDVVQNVILQLWDHHSERLRGKLAFELARPLNSKYIRTTLTREGRREARRLQRGQTDTGFVESVAQAQSVETSEVIETLRLAEAALSQASPRQREALRMRYLENKGIGEIASVLGTSSNAVYTLLSRGRSQILKAFGRKAK